MQSLEVKQSSEAITALAASWRAWEAALAYLCLCEDDEFCATGRCSCLMKTRSAAVKPSTGSKQQPARGSMREFGGWSSVIRVLH